MRVSAVASHEKWAPAPRSGAPTHSDDLASHVLENITLENLADGWVHARLRGRIP